METPTETPPTPEPPQPPVPPRPPQTEPAPAPDLTASERVYGFTAEALYQLVFEAGGAATGPLLQDNPDYVFPSERVADALRHFLEDQHHIPAPEGYRARG